MNFLFLSFLFCHVYRIQYTFLDYLVSSYLIPFFLSSGLVYMNDMKLCSTIYLVIMFCSPDYGFLKPKHVAVNHPMYKTSCDWWLLTTCVTSSQRDVTHKKTNNEHMNYDVFFSTIKKTKLDFCAKYLKKRLTL